MPILPDYLRHGLSVVFCGTAAGKKSASRGHYYSGSGNEFWRYLFEAGLTPVQLRPDDDQGVCKFNLGLTDLAQEVSASSDRGLRPHYRVAKFTSKIELFKPLWVAFHGKEAAKEVARSLKKPSEISLGRQSWLIGNSSVFVLPSASGANRDPARLEGKASRLEWFKELAQIVNTVDKTE